MRETSVMERNGLAKCIPEFIMIIYPIRAVPEHGRYFQSLLLTDSDVPLEREEQNACPFCANSTGEKKVIWSWVVSIIHCCIDLQLGWGSLRKIISDPDGIQDSFFPNMSESQLGWLKQQGLLGILLSLCVASFIFLPVWKFQFHQTPQMVAYFPPVHKNRTSRLAQCLKFEVLE